MGNAREWNLSWRMRLGIVCCAVASLLLTRPWTESDPSRIMTACGGALAFLVLAVIPKRTRFWVAVGSAIVVPIVAGIIINLAAAPR